jgi:hypothetical protein
MYYVVICTEAYLAPFGTQCSTIFSKGDVYQAEHHGEEYRVWRNKVSFLRFSDDRFQRYFRIFC